MKVKQSIMFVISLLLFLLTLVLGVVFAVALYKETSYQRICLTPGCIHSASTVLKYMNQTVDPCADFYQFACGGFLKDADIPEDSSKMSQFDMVSNRIMEQLKAILDDPNQSSKLLKMVKKTYNMCMNTTDFEVNGLDDLRQLLKDLGGWPLLEGENWNGGTFEWKNLMYKFRRIGFPTSNFIGFDLTDDKQNSSKLIITINEPSLPLSKSLLNGFEDPFVKIYYDYMVDMAVLFGIDKHFAETEINQTIHFTIALANATVVREKTRNVTTLYNLMTIEELQINYPFVPWLEYITNLVDVPDLEITEDEVVNVSPHFLSNVGPLLRRTPKRVLANYLMEGVVRDYAAFLPKRFRDREQEYYYSASSRRQFRPLWKSCMSQAITSAPPAVAAAYIRKHFDKESKKQAESMIANIRKTFYKMVESNNWMEDETKSKSLEKARTMAVYVGYPEELLDDDAVEKLYLNVEIDYSSFIKSHQSLMLFYADEYYKLLRQPINKTHWTRRILPIAVKGYYSFTKNSLNFPAGILQGVFFGNNRPRYMNYGAIGSIIGHEITHGFDDFGKDYNKDGNVENWWGEETERKFTEKARCVIDKYGRYRVPELNLTVDGNHTQNENIADIAGVKAAYLAYQAWVKENGPEPRLPGLHFTPNQMFWISTAIKNCVKYRKEALETKLTTDTQSPGKFRVLGPSSNSEFFSKDFKCPLGSPMNPHRKCEMW